MLFLQGEDGPYSQEKFTFPGTNDTPNVPIMHVKKHPSTRSCFVFYFYASTNPVRTPYERSTQSVFCAGNQVSAIISDS